MSSCCPSTFNGYNILAIISNDFKSIVYRCAYTAKSYSILINGLIECNFAGNRRCNLQTSVEPLWVGFLWKGLCWKPRELQKCGPNKMLGKSKKNLGILAYVPYWYQDKIGAFISYPQPNPIITYHLTILQNHITTCGVPKLRYFRIWRFIIPSCWGWSLSGNRKLHHIDDMDTQLSLLAYLHYDLHFYGLNLDVSCNPVGKTTRFAGETARFAGESMFNLYLFVAKPRSFRLFQLQQELVQAAPPPCSGAGSCATSRQSHAWQSARAPHGGCRCPDTRGAVYFRPSGVIKRGNRGNEKFFWKLRF